ncbi:MULTISPECIES: hypothetical protein [Gordonia]|uniref:hypothetical protein n=1 Tax=Gordonia TaxID=2053 RepID=UPI00257E7C52|nr:MULTISPECIES: hypothetical protein [Gordonia]
MDHRIGARRDVADMLGGDDAVAVHEPHRDIVAGHLGAATLDPRSSGGTWSGVAVWLTTTGIVGEVAGLNSICSGYVGIGEAVGVFGGLGRGEGGFVAHDVDDESRIGWWDGAGLRDLRGAIGAGAGAFES